MPDVDIIVQATSEDGLVATYRDDLVAADDYLFLNNGKVVVHARNEGATARTLTFEVPLTVDEDLAVADLVVSVGADTDAFIGPFPTQWYNDTARKIHMTVEGTLPSTDLSYGKAATKTGAFSPAASTETMDPQVAENITLPSPGAGEFWVLEVDDAWTVVSLVDGVGDEQIGDWETATSPTTGMTRYVTTNSLLGTEGATAYSITITTDDMLKVAMIRVP